MERETPPPSPQDPDSEDPHGPLTEKGLDEAYRLNELVDARLAFPAELAKADDRRLAEITEFPKLEEWKAMDYGQKSEWTALEILHRFVKGLNIRHGTLEEDHGIKADLVLEPPENPIVPIQMKTLSTESKISPEKLENMERKIREAERTWRRAGLKGVVLEISHNPEDIVNFWGNFQKVTTENAPTDVQGRARATIRPVIGQILQRLREGLEADPALRPAYNYYLECLEAT